MDGQYLNYNGQMFAARKAVQRIAFSPTHPTHLELPIYQEGFLQSLKRHQLYQMISFWCFQILLQI